MRAGQQLLHDVGVKDVPAARQALPLCLQFLVFLDLVDKSPTGDTAAPALGISRIQQEHPQPSPLGAQQALTSS